MFFNIRKKSDEDLMSSIQLGDRAALTELYRRYNVPLLRYFYRMLWKDKELAEDFLQDIFMKVIQHAESFNLNMRFSTWIYSVAHNMCKNEYRKKAFRDSVHLHHGEEVIRTRVLEPEQLPDLKWHIEKTVGLLDEDDKHLFTLRFELDLPLGEIAAALNCPIGTVKSRVFNLKKKLAEQLQGLSPLTRTVWK